MHQQLALHRHQDEPRWPAECASPASSTSLYLCGSLRQAASQIDGLTLHCVLARLTMPMRVECMRFSSDVSNAVGPQQLHESDRLLSHCCRLLRMYLQFVGASCPHVREVRLLCKENLVSCCQGCAPVSDDCGPHHDVIRQHALSTACTAIAVSSC